MMKTATNDWKVGDLFWQAEIEDPQGRWRPGEPRRTSAEARADGEAAMSDLTERERSKSRMDVYCWRVTDVEDGQIAACVEH